MKSSTAVSKNLSPYLTVPISYRTEPYRTIIELNVPYATQGTVLDYNLNF